MTEAGAARARESIPRSTAFALAMRIVGAAFTGGLTIFLVRYLGPDDYGIFALALSVAGLLILPADFGISRSAARFIAERFGDDRSVAGVFRQALALKVLGASLVALVLIGAAGPIAGAYGEPSLEWPLRIMGVTVFAQSYLMLFTGTFEALGRNALGFRVALSESAVEVSTSIGLVLAGAGIVGATTGRAAGYCFAALLGLWLALRLVGRSRRRAGERSTLSLRRIAGYAGALFVIDAAFAAFNQVDILMIGAILDSRSAGLFSAPVQILIFAQYLGIALAAGVAPRLARGDQGKTADVAPLQDALRLLLVFQFVLVAPIVVWATPITDLLFGAGYEDSADVLRALGPYVLMIGPGPLLALTVNYLGEARLRVPLALAAVGINAAIDVLLIPEIGIVAGAIGTNVAYFVFVSGHLLICRRLLGLRLVPIARTLLRASLAAAAMAGVLLAFGTESLTAVEAVAGIVMGTLAYSVVILLEFTPAELRRGVTAARAVVGRVTSSGRTR